MQDDQQVAEDALREALSRLGSGRAQNARPTQSPERRRRFVREGQVVVEHQSARGAAPMRMGAPDDQEEIERLKQAVKREQRRWEETERHLGEARSQIKALETRAAHARIQITELNAEIREHKDTIQSLKAQVHQAQDQAARATTRSPRPVGRPRKERPAELADAGSEAVADTRNHASADVMGHAGDHTADQQPVQWWVRG